MDRTVNLRILLRSPTATWPKNPKCLRPGIACATRWGSAGLDLPGEARRELESLGVLVTASGVCTFENEDYFSYRRNPDTGRLAGLVWSGK